MTAAGPHGLGVDRPIGWVHERVLTGGLWRLAPQQVLDRLQQVWDRENRGLRLVSGRRLRGMNSVPYAPDPGGRIGVPPIELSVADAREAGIAEGDRIRVENERGSIDGVAHIDPRVREGVVTVAHGWTGQSVGRLTDEATIDPLTGQA